MSVESNTTTAAAGHAPSLKTLDKLVAEQGVRPISCFEDLFGAGRELWTDEEFEALLEQVRVTRREGT